MATSNRGSGREISVPCMGSPIAALGPTAEFYFTRSSQLAEACSHAMVEGNLALANELYERGVNAMHNAIWHKKLAQCVGSDFTVMDAKWESVK